MKKSISMILIVAMLMMFMSVTAFASDDAVSYVFSGTNSMASGYAQGTVTYTADSAGTYYLYWADSTKALPKYYEITSFVLSSGGKGTYTFAEQVAIPDDATCLIVSKSSTCDDAAVATAVAKYDLPSYKLPHKSADISYTYAAFSDIHIDMQGGGNKIYYANSVDHFKKALADCVDRNVDFVVTSGDDITNADGETLEWLTYQKTLADSDYVNPIYEAIGNHETRISKYQKCDPKCGLETYINATGMGTAANEVVSSKSYFEMTEPTTGDHFIFMSLENHSDANEHDEFSDAQISWVTNLLNKYDGDGHNIFLIEHALIRGYGAGDDNDAPGYKGGLNMAHPETGEVFANNIKFKQLLESHKDVIWLSGHTHLDFADDKNYSNENGTSCHMIHVPSCCNTTRLAYDDKGNRCLDYTFYEDTSQGYFVDVYDDAVIFKGTNLYYNKIYPQYSYIISDTKAQQPTDKPTQATCAPVTEQPTDKPTQAITTPVTEQPTQPATQLPTEGIYVLGDVNLNGKVDIADATYIQRHLARLITLSDEQKRNAKVSGADDIAIVDATIIQRYLAKLINKFPAQNIAATSSKPNADIAVASALSSQQAYDKASEYLKRYYQYASYDAYQSLKKTFYKYKSLSSSSLSASAIAELEAGISGFDSLHSKVNIQTVYYSDSKSFGNMKAYYWHEGGSNFENWPGQKATYIKTNSMSQNIYAVTLNFSKYDSVIFNGDGGQTKDITLDGRSGVVYYANEKDTADGKWKVESSVYDRMWYQESAADDPTPTEEITIYFTNNLDWSSLKCYWWVNTTNNTWPGQNLTYVRNTSTGKAIYKMVVPKGASVIFTTDNGAKQTVDITDVQDGYGYYPTSKNSSGKYNVTQYVYG